MNGLDLFSGIGGLTLALSPWVRPVLYCESDRYAQAVLLSEIGRGSIPFAPIWDDIRTLEGSLVGSVDIVYGGFPCQDISVAGTRAGLEGQRSSLFGEVVRLAKEMAPTFIFLENVWSGIGKYIPTIRNAFEELRYQCRDGHLAASDIGFPFKGERWFLLATKTDRIDLWLEQRRSERSDRPIKTLDRPDVEKGNSSSARAGSQKKRISSSDEAGLTFVERPFPSISWDQCASELIRMDHGIPFRSHRIRGLGNAVVPLQAREAFKRLMGI